LKDGSEGQVLKGRLKAGFNRQVLEGSSEKQVLKGRLKAGFLRINSKKQIKVLCN
jgi:hypothetical protein